MYRRIYYMEATDIFCKMALYEDFELQPTQLTLTYSKQKQYTSNLQIANEITICTSQSSPMTLSNIYSTHCTIRRIQDLVHLVNSQPSRKVSFIWIPSHIVIDGNEKADMADIAENEQKEETIPTLPTVNTTNTT